MSVSRKHIPSYYYWDLDKGRKVHVQELKIREMEENGVIHKPFRINYYAIRWVQKGEGHVMVDHVPVKLAPNLIIMGNPSQITQYDIDFDGDLEVLLIVFTDELLSMMSFEKEGISLIYQLSNELELYPEGHEKETLKGIFDLIFKEYHSDHNPNFKDEIMASMIRLLIQYIFRIHSKTELNKGGLKYRNLYRNFIDKLEQNFRDIHSVTEYSNMLMISEKTLNRACKKLTNLTANKIIQNRVDFEAKRMLMRKEVNIKQIGYDLGFRTSSHFNKFFRNLNDTTPGKFRKSILK